MATIGIDAVEIERFAQWARYTKKKLSRILSDQEIAYCLSTPSKAAERFAVRFAAKEALYKALSSHEESLSFLTLCRHCEIVKDASDRPRLLVNWAVLGLKEQTASLSLTHTKTTALVVVLLD